MQINVRRRHGHLRGRNEAVPDLFRLGCGACLRNGIRAFTTVEGQLLAPRHVSGGAYAMVGTVIIAAMDLLARAAPGTSTRFVAVSEAEALEARGDLAERRNKAWAALGASR